MGTKLVTAFITGVFFTFFLDFFFILGLFLNYIQAQEIDVYYNVLFADNQNIFIYMIGVIIFGYLFIFFKNTKIAASVFLLSLIVVNLTQIPSVGKSVGSSLFQEDNKIINRDKHQYIGHIVYRGRYTVWFYDDELENIIEFKLPLQNEMR